MNTIAPSRPGYNLRTADLRNVSVDAMTIDHIIASGRETPDAMVLLAELLKRGAPRNARYQAVAYQYPVYTQQQVLTENKNRAVLVIQNVGTGDIFALMEGSNPTPQDFSGNPTQLSYAQTRAIRIVAGGNFTPQIPPSNAISLFTLNAVANGVIIEG